MKTCKFKPEIDAKGDGGGGCDLPCGAISASVPRADQE